MSDWLSKLFGRNRPQSPADQPASPSGAPTPTAALFAAIGAHDTDAAKQLFAAHPDQVGAFIPFGGGTYLHYAASSGAEAIVAHLLDLGLDVNVRDREGRTALCSAASQGCVDVATLLLDRGAAMDVSESIRNPMFACISGYRGQRDEPRERFLTVAELLIARGVDLTACYIQQSMVDMDATAFAIEFGRTDIAEAILRALYGDDKRLTEGARAEACEVALGNAYSRERFRKWRYPSKRAALLPPPGEFWS